MPTHLNRLRVVHGGEDAPEHEVSKADVLLRFLNQELSKGITGFAFDGLLDLSGVGAIGKLGLSIALLSLTFLLIHAHLTKMKQVGAKLRNVKFNLLRKLLI